MLEIIKLCLLYSFFEILFIQQGKHNIFIYVFFHCGSKERKNYFKMNKSTKMFLLYYNLFIHFLLTYVFLSASSFRQKTYMAHGLMNGVLNKT